jgi:hypothetical protein
MMGVPKQFGADGDPLLLARTDPSRGEMLSIVTEAAAAGQIFGVRLPSADEDDEPWAAPPSRRNKEPPIEGPLPNSVEVVLGNQVYIDRSKLPELLGDP